MRMRSSLSATQRRVSTAGSATSAVPLVEFRAPRVDEDAIVGPVVDGFAEPGIAGVAHRDQAVLAALVGDACSTCLRTQGAVVSRAQGLTGLREHRGGDDPPTPGKERRIVTSRCSHFCPSAGSARLSSSVAMCFSHCLRCSARRRSRGSSICTACAQASDSSRGQVQRRRAQCCDHFVGPDARDAMCSQDPLDGIALEVLALRRRGRPLQQLPEPRIARCRTQPQRLRPVPRELLAQPVRESVSSSARCGIVGQADARRGAAPSLGTAPAVLRGPRFVAKLKIMFTTSEQAAAYPMCPTCYSEELEKVEDVGRCDVWVSPFGSESAAKERTTFECSRVRCPNDHFFRLYGTVPA
jgi:hypothetical protein